MYNIVNTFIDIHFIAICDHISADQMERFGLLRWPYSVADLFIIGWQFLFMQVLFKFGNRQ